MTTTHPRGAAMTETVLVLPLVLLILSLLFFFGRGFVRLQQASVLDRYEAWRAEADAPGPAAGGAGHPELNATFYAGDAQHIEGRVERYEFPETADLLRTAAARQSPDAGRYLDAAFDAFPAGLRASFSTTHAHRVPLWQRIDGPIHHAHVRLGNEWKFANGLRHILADDRWEPAPPHVTPAGPIRDQFLSDLDDRLAPLASSGNNLAASIRRSYLGSPGYGGPTLSVQPNP